MVHTCFCQSMPNPTFFKVRNRISFIETKDIFLSHIEYNCNHFTNYKIYIWNMSCVCSAVFISSKNAIDIQGLPSEKPKFLRNVLFAQKIAYFSYVRPNDIGQCRQFDCCSSDILLQKSTKCQIVNSKKD